MNRNISISCPVVSGDPERFSFVLHVDDVEKPGYISRSALVQLAHGQIGTDADIFRRNEKKICEAAYEHSWRNPAHMVIVLSTNDF